VAWSKELTNYPASNGWQLSYRLRGPRNYEIPWVDNVTANGDSFSISISAATTAPYVAGTYWLFGFASKGGERYQVVKSEVTIQQNAQSASQSFDGRTHAKKMLDAIEAMLEGTASREESSYQIDIAGKMRQLSFFSRDELLRFRNFYKNEYARELSAQRIAQGKGGGRKILVRFK